MELLGIVFSVPAAFVASAVYSFLLERALRKRPWMRRVAVAVSVLVLAGLAAEWALLATLGPLRSRRICGPGFYPAHLALFFLSVPALASFLVAKKEGSRLGSWLVVAFLCACLALPVVLTQYAVSEALFGIDGVGGPYGSP